MRAPALYQRIVDVLETSGYTRWDTTLSMRGVPEAEADRLFQVVPESADPQTRLRGEVAGTYAVEAPRKWRILVLYRIAGSVRDIVRDLVLPEEERITDELLALEQAVSVSASYLEVEGAGGQILMTLELQTLSGRPA